MNIYKDYTTCVEENLNLSKKDLWFKSDPRYQYILEHVDPEQGNKYLELIKSEFSSFYDNHKKTLIDLCRLNDQYGRPRQFYFVDFDICGCSPTNLRYTYQALLVLDYIKKLELPKVKIIEIGGGYGGLCLFIKKLSSYVGIDIDSYTIYDIPQIELLQEKYLDIHEVSLISKDEVSEGSFLVSNYAFSELPENLRKDYEDNVINKYCSHGFLAWNAVPLYDFVKNKQVTSEEERPLTAPNNLHVYFK